MKKMITLLLVLTGMVCTASAAKLYVSIENRDWWTSLRVYAWNSDGNNGWTDPSKGIVESAISRFGKSWYEFDMGLYTGAIVQQYGLSEETLTVYNKTEDITVGDEDKYIIIADWSRTDGNTQVYNYIPYSAPAFRDNGTTGFSTTTPNMTEVDYNTLTYTMTKDYVDAISGDDIWFRIYNFGNQLYPNAEGLHINIAGSTSDYFNNTTETSWSFGITKPSYDYEKIVVTAAYNTSASMWTISVDAYISKTITAANEYATLGCSVPLDITSLPAGVTAYTVTADASTKKISKAEKTTALAANEGVLLQNASDEDVTLSIPVAAEASASASNGMVAFTGSGNLTQPGSDYTYYILANQNDHVGFYKVNTTDGNEMGANTAYLRVNGTVAARDFYWFDDEATGITSTAMQPGIGQYYDLQGRRVAQPAKGLYIVNGKKIVIR